MAKPMQNRTQPGQGYRTSVMQRPPYPGAPQPVRPGAVMPPVSALTREERLEAKRLAEEASFSSDGSVFDIRETDESSSAIANAITIPAGAVKADRSCGTKPNAAPGKLCVNCGAPIQTPDYGREKQFCCRHCYNKWWHANHTARTAYNRICPVCGKEFTVRSNKSQKYCSANCYQAARKAGGEEYACREDMTGEKDAAEAFAGKEHEKPNRKTDKEDD